MISESGRALSGSPDGFFEFVDTQERVADDPLTPRTSSMLLWARIVATDDVETRRCRTLGRRPPASPLAPFSSNVSLRARFFVGVEGTDGTTRTGVDTASSFSGLDLLKLFVSDMVDLAGGASAPPHATTETGLTLV